MKLPLKWLKEYVDFNVTLDEFVELMMWRGFEIAEIADEMPGISNVVVGRIEKIEQHPNAEKLKICSVNIGKGDNLCLVTGAPNVFEGALVPVALDGATLTGGIVIHPTVMRGVESCGMLCSGEELGITDADYPGASVYGILILQGEHPLGQPIQEAVGLNDVVFDIELTPNRADCISIIGMCREAAAALGQKFKEPVIKQVLGEGDARDYATVQVLDGELCPRYIGRVVKDIRIAPSPAWMQKKLRSVGMRPINNIVDITNYVMIEYGQPMHAFDFACITDGHIIVRRGKEDEIVKTLDGKARKVSPNVLLIADPARGVGIAGVMGGENSEITENTKTVFFESAVFKGSNIRHTTRELHHVTDAAARYIKGVEPVNTKLAIDRAIELVAELDAGTIVGGNIDVCAADLTERVINVDWNHVNRILNTEISPEDMVKMLDTINIGAVVDGKNLVVTIPHYRVDIESSIESDWDIAEEIARVYGYYNIEPTMMTGDTFRGRLSPETRHEDEIKDMCVSMGCYEMYNYNFTGPAALSALGITEDDEKYLAVKLMNPFGEDQSLMRTTLMAGMLNSVALNCNRKTGHGRFFEVGNVHIDNNDDLPEERKILGIIFTGADESFFTLKGVIEYLLRKLGIGERAEFLPGGSGFFQPGQKAVIKVDGQVIGEMGTVHPDTRKAFGVPQAAYAAELSMKKLFELRENGKTYKAIPKYPTVPRDIAVVVDEKMTSAQVAKVIKDAPVKVLLENVELFDVYRGTGIPEGKKSMAYSYTVRAEDRTLTDEDITEAMNTIIRVLKEKLDADLRA
ncbi:MAG: phenylalanine--tRNA ligase subunit beta [Clostridia bacterium]|nr:phenylalanine--tRNA ligase subunit beta [Clostridia bacterium]